MCETIQEERNRNGKDQSKGSGVEVGNAKQGSGVEKKSKGYRVGVRGMMHEGQTTTQ